jgi:hypothetical protein
MTVHASRSGGAADGAYEKLVERRLHFASSPRPPQPQHEDPGVPYGSSKHGSQDTHDMTYEVNCAHVICKA